MKKDVSLKNRMGLYVVTLITLILSAFAYFNYQSIKSQRSTQILDATQRISEPPKNSPPPPPPQP